MTSQEDPAAICPESTIESANVRSSAQKQASRNDDRLACESTIESSLRRGFIKKAALGTAAVGIGASLIGRSVISHSSASSDANCISNLFIKCSFAAWNDVIVDGNNHNCGTLASTLFYCSNSVLGSACDYPNYALTFGSIHDGKTCTCASQYTHSGEGIASARTSGSFNQYGLDFYTCYTKRISITKSGNVGIGTCSPSTQFQVDSSGYLVGKFKNNSSGICRTALVQVETGDTTPLEWNIGVAGAGNGLGISDGNFYLERLTNGTSSGAKVTINGCGYVGIGVTSPKYPLEVNGDINALSEISAAEMTSGTCVWVDTSNYCNGNNTYGFPIWIRGRVAFGCGGEGIGSQRNTITYPGCPTCCPSVCYPPGKNLHGLDFYTCYTKRVSITNSGNVGIGTCTPSSTLEVVSSGPSCVPLTTKGASGQTANLQQWENNCGTIFAVLSSAGSLGLGGVTKPHHVLCISGKAHASSGFSIGPCTCINTTLVVNGSMAAKTRCVSASSSLATTDYGIFASGAITLTLPPAKTQKGMMLFIKNTSTSTVTIKPGGTDTIEGATSSSPKTLGKQYDSLQLISNGSSEWFIVGSVKCGAVIS